MNTFRTFALIALLCGVTHVATAQQAQSPVTITPVQEVLTNTPDDAYVTVQGRLVEYLGDEDYVLEDETGRITVEIDDDLLEPRDFKAGMLVEVFGEVDRERHGVELEAERIRVL